MKINISKEIPNSEDWRTDTEDPMINAFRELMAYNNQFQDDPNVGIFWYDVNNNELFGVVTANASDVQYYNSSIFNAPARTCKPLHYKIWQKKIIFVVKIPDFKAIIHQFPEDVYLKLRIKDLLFV